MCGSTTHFSPGVTRKLGSLDSGSGGESRRGPVRRGGSDTSDDDGRGFPSSAACDGGQMRWTTRNELKVLLL